MGNKYLTDFWNRYPNDGAIILVVEVWVQWKISRKDNRKSKAKRGGHCRWEDNIKSRQ